MAGIWWFGQFHDPRKSCNQAVMHTHSSTLSSGLNRKQKWSRGGGGGGGYHERKSGMKHSLQMKVYNTVQYVQGNILERFK